MAMNFCPRSKKDLGTAPSEFKRTSASYVRLYESIGTTLRDPRGNRVGGTRATQTTHHARAAMKTLPRQVSRRKARATSTLRVRTPGAIYSLDSREKHSSARYNPPPSARPPALLHGALAPLVAASRRAAPRGAEAGLLSEKHRPHVVVSRVCQVTLQS